MSALGEIVLKANNCSCKEVCSRCGLDDRADSPIAAFHEGTWDWVCWSCVAQEWGLADGRAMFERICVLLADAPRTER